VNGSDLGPWIVGLVAVVAAGVTGWWQWRIARSAPPSVAQGYGALVADLRSDLDRLRIAHAECMVNHEKAEAEIVNLESDLRALRVRVYELEQRVSRPPSIRSRHDDPTGDDLS